MQNRDEMVCHCASVTKGQIWDALDAGAKTVKDVCRMTGAGTIGHCKEMNPKGT